MMKILYVEDNSVDAELLQKKLGRQKPPFDIDVTTGLKEAFECMDDEDGYELVLIDVMLPDGSGLDLLKDIRKKKLPIAVVVLTGFGDEETAVAALKAGADDYVVKKSDYLERLPGILKDARQRFQKEILRRSNPLRVLYAESDSDDIELTLWHFSRAAPYIHLDVITTADQVIVRLEDTCDSVYYDVLLLNYRLPDLSALELIKKIRQEKCIDIPAVLITGHGSEDLAVQSLRLGFSDYLVKSNGYLSKLPVTLENAYRAAELSRERERLKKSEEKYRILIENAGEAIFVVQNERLKFANGKTELLTGYTLKDLVSRPFKKFIHPDDREIVKQGSLQLQSGEDVPGNYRFRFIHASGDTRWADLNVVAIDWEGAVATLNFAKDITQEMQDRKEKQDMEAQFRQAQKMEAVGRLAGGVAHDFNNMLSVINGYAAMALEKLNTLDPLYDDLVEIQQAGQRSATITKQLLGFARKQAVKPIVMDLNTHIRSSEKIFRQLIGEDIDVKVIPAADLWPIKIDPSQVDQILMNLSVNSRDAISGVGRIIIETANKKLGADDCRAHPNFTEGNFVLLTFTDSGCGMDQETQSMIFEPFFTTKEEGQGTGLGASTVYGIVKQNNGFIQVYSEPGHGTVFKIYFPRFEDRIVSEAKQKDEGGSSLRGFETILVVEDEQQILRLCQRVLESKGYTVFTAGRPEEAIELCETYAGEIQLLITDVVMPSMNGKDLQKRLKLLKPKMRVLYMSGYAANVITHRGGLEEGVNFIQKPFLPREIALKVRELFEKELFDESGGKLQ